MKVTPLDLRQTQFRTALRGYDKAEVRALLADAADDLEQAVREIDRLRQEVMRTEAVLAEHREREAHLRNTLLSAQRLADQMRENAEQQARATLKEAETRADQLLHKAQRRLETIGHDIESLRSRRRQMEGSLEATISTLTGALDEVRSQRRFEPPPIQTPSVAREAPSAQPVGTPVGVEPATDAPPAPAEVKATVDAPATPVASASGAPREPDEDAPPAEQEEMLAELRRFARSEEGRASATRRPTGPLSLD